MKKLTIFLTQILACGLLAAPSSAQFIPQATAIPGSAPEGINYQGRLEDGGFPVNATKSMIFRVYTAPVGGVLLWTSPTQAVPVALGLFSAVVPVPTTVLVGGGARYLEVSIDGTLMSPRELLNSVPYALIAKSVEGNIDVSTAGLSINANSTAPQPALYISSVTGNVGVGTGSPITAFDVGGSAQFGSGTTKSTFSATGALNTAGKITAPDYTATYGLSAATATVSNEILIGGGASVATFGLHLADRNVILSGTGNELRFSGPQAALIGHAGAFDTTLQSNGVVRQTIESGGHTRFASGISASSGTFRGNGAFHESSADNSVNIFWGAPDGTSGWTAGSGVTANDGMWRLYSNDTVATPIAVDDAAGNKITMAASGGLTVTGGNVGIGTTNPSAKLDVQEASSTSSYSLRAGTSATAYHIVVSTMGDIGIGTTGPANKLHVQGSDAAGRMTLIENTAAGGDPEGLLVLTAQNGGTGAKFAVGTGSVGSHTKNFVVTNAGNVGIGTTGPSNKLHVQGSDAAGRMAVIENTGASGAPEGLLVLTAQNGGTGAKFAVGTGSVGSHTKNFVVTNAGNVGIGTTEPAAKLHMSSGTMVIDGDASTGLQVFDSTFTVLSSGNVGIGTTAPGGTLTVKGDTRFESAGTTSPIDYRWRITGPTADYDTLYLSGEGVTGNNTFGDIGDGNSIVSFKAKGENEVGIGYDAGAAGHTAKLSVNGNVGIGKTNPAVALDVMDQGELGLGAFTQAQVNAKTPGKVGTLILNSSINQVCVSTGTTIMGYAKIRDGATCQ